MGRSRMETVKRVGGGSGEESASPSLQLISSFLSASSGTLREALLPLVSCLGIRFVISSFLLTLFLPQIPPFNFCIFACCFLHQNLFLFPFLTLFIKTCPSRFHSNVTPSKKPSRCPPQVELTCSLCFRLLRSHASPFFGPGLASVLRLPW